MLLSIKVDRAAARQERAMRAPAVDRWSVGFMVVLLLVSPILPDLVARLGR